MLQIAELEDVLCVSNGRAFCSNLSDLLVVDLCTKEEIRVPLDFTPEGVFISGEDAWVLMQNRILSQMNSDL